MIFRCFLFSVHAFVQCIFSELIEAEILPLQIDCQSVFSVSIQHRDVSCMEEFCINARAWRRKKLKETPSFR